jgi:hypothetical protein
MTKCVISYFEKTVQDSDIHSVVAHHKNTIEKHLQMSSDIFKSVGFPIPIGFVEQDVNLDAPKLYSDIFIIKYLKYVCKFSLINLSIALSMVTREDVRKFFDESIEYYKDLSNRVDSILLKKGLYLRSPYIPTPDRVEFVENRNYLGGFITDILGKERPINSMEIAHAVANIQTNTLGMALLTGFIQVTKNKDLQAYFKRGKDISSKHVEILGNLLKEEDLPVPMTWDSEVQKSTIPPFSDKLMLFHTTALIGYGLGIYGLGVANSMRADVASIYTRFITEIGQYSKDGMVMMINNGWLEKTPETVNRNDIVSV